MKNSKKGIKGDGLKGNEEYRAFMERLAEANVDNYIDLPQIAVMGDTSSGKSSLLSMISTVELPSSDKLTTRCPIELNMKKRPEKSATVEIRWKDHKPSQEFKPRQIDEKNWPKLTDAIADAQDFIIAQTRKEVSKSVVSVAVFGPECEDLTLVDLPGIVRSVGKGESATLSTEIQDLMDCYLKNQRCVILAVHPCNVDFHNSQIMANAREVDPQTTRTIPVLTKPDLIDVGAEGSVKELLLGLKTDDFAQGFHMVRGRGQQSLNKNVTIEAALTDEMDFFKNTDPWKSVASDSYFGTRNLRVKLGKLQMERMRQEFPGIIAELRANVAEVVAKLDTFGNIPETISEKRATFSRIKDEAVNLVEPILTGCVGTDRTASSIFHEKSTAFVEKLEKSTLATVMDIAVGKRVLCEYGGTDYIGTIILVQPTYITVQLDGGQGNADITPDKVQADATWIKEIIEKRRGLELPTSVNPEVFKGIVVGLLEQDWKQPSEDLAQETADIALFHVKTAINGCKSLNAFPDLRAGLLRINYAVCMELFQQVKTKVMDAYDTETNVYTRNTRLFEKAEEETLKPLQQNLEAHMASLGRGTQSVDMTALKEQVTSIYESNNKASVEDLMARKTMFTLDSYGKVAFDRYTDTLPSICSQILRHYHTHLNEALHKVTDEDLEEWMEVSPADSEKYATWQEELKTLEAGIAILGSN